MRNHRHHRRTSQHPICRDSMVPQCEKCSGPTLPMYAKPALLSRTRIPDRFLHSPDDLGYSAHPEVTGTLMRAAAGSGSASGASIGRIDEGIHLHHHTGSVRFQDSRCPGCFGIGVWMFRVWGLPRRLASNVDTAVSNQSGKKGQRSLKLCRHFPK